MEYPKNGLDVRKINPNNGDKYSPNLYRWLIKRDKKHRAWSSRVYRSSDDVLWIGGFFDGDFIGARLNEVLCNGAKQDSACWVTLNNLVEVDDFWQRYTIDGRCAIDTDHDILFVGDGSRWKTEGDNRSCTWCGKASQVMKRWTEAVERSKWIMK